MNSACLRTNRVEITTRLHLDSSILLLGRERQGKYTVDKRDESCTKSRDDLTSVQIFPAFKQLLPRSGAQLRDPGCEDFVFLKHPRPCHIHACWVRRIKISEMLRCGMIRSLTTRSPDTRREHHLAVPRAYEPPLRHHPRRLPRPSQHRLRTRFLPRATHPHSPNLHPRR